MTRLRAIWLGLALLAASSAVAQPAPPPPRDPAPAAVPVTGPVSVQVMVVRATNANDRVDPELKGMLKQLSFTRFTGFDLVDTQNDSLTTGEEASFAIEGQRRLRVTLVDRDETSARLRVRLVGANGTALLDSTVSVHRNRTFMVAGPKIGDDVLILPITAKY